MIDSCFSIMEYDRILAAVIARHGLKLSMRMYLLSVLY